ncbi:MAG: hypothetical protein IH899_15530 [Planctomycetes bacterium]|nr:hypothetical protein [Planctomycetota bacterium]
MLSKLFNLPWPPGFFLPNCPCCGSSFFNIIKFDKLDGAVIWRAAHDEQFGLNHVSSLVVDSADSVYTVAIEGTSGRVEKRQSGNGDLLLSFEDQHAAPFKGSQSVIVDSSGNIYTTIAGIGANPDDIDYLFKYSSGGTLLLSTSQSHIGLTDAIGDNRMVINNFDDIFMTKRATQINPAMMLNLSGAWPTN